jgi:TatD DNase family protein
MFDSHCHLHDRRVLDAEAQIARAHAAGVTGFLLAGVEPSGWADERAIVSAHPDILMAFGVHPQLVAEIDDVDPLIAQLDTVVRGDCSAIGEIGLDGMDQYKATLDRQERAFRAQLAFARARQLPVVLHVLRAHQRALEILRADGVPGGVLHSCSASADQVREYLRLGLHVSFAGTVCNPGARKVHDAARAVPAERLLVETDAPFQTPLPHRPAQNEPAFLVAIVEALARIRGERPEEVAQQTETNARRLLQK